MTSYLAPARPSVHEIEVSRSRFLAHLIPVTSEEEARDAVVRIRGEHPQARHHCTAFVIGPDARLRRTNDDGEPSGTAGAPMLEALVAAGVSDVLAVVVRYFGGVLLGTGGLARAYRGAVAAALERAPLALREERAVLRVRLDYADAAAVSSLAERSGWTTTAEYGEAVDVTIAVPKEASEAAEAALAGTTAGRGRVHVDGVTWVARPTTRLKPTTDE